MANEDIIKKLEETVLKLEEEKKQLLKLVSHDVKSPFNKLFALNHLLRLVSEDLNEEQLDYLGRMEWVIKEGLTVVRNLMDLRAIENNNIELNLETLQIEPILFDTFKNYSKQTDTKNISILPQIDKVTAWSDKRAVERVFDLEMLLWDMSGRIDFWGRIANHALENPIFGSGGASHNIGTSGGTAFSLGSAHNVLVSTLVTSGVPGLIILLSLIWAVYKVFKVIDNKTISQCVLGKSVLASVSVLLMVAVTNDFSGGRVFLWFMFLAISARMLNELPRMAWLEKTEDEIDADEPQVNKQTTGVRLR